MTPPPYDWLPQTPPPAGSDHLDGLLSIYGRLARGAPPPPGTQLHPGAVVGHFHLVEKLAEGGMGVVWRARQTDPVEREVALKVLKAGLDTAKFVRRFRQEWETLARLEHPNIARLYEAGTTASGRPFLAMELIPDARAITEHATLAGLGLREKLSLFADVCAAVQFAHQRGVIHRDLKPGNLLVGSHDGVPRPMVIDFGVSRALGRAGDGGLTEAGVLLGTPAYMSPEQLDEGENAIDTRSDVYALGAVLYELICEAPPFDAARLANVGVLEMARIVATDEPDPPSDRVKRTSGDAGTRISHELDWIVAMAMAKNPERRYRSAAELEADLRRHLSGEPVMACGDSLSYRVGKFVRRHRPAVAAAGIVVLSLLGAAAASAWQARKESQERRNAEAILRFFDEDLVRTAHEASFAADRGDWVAPALQRIHREFGERPVLAARLRTTLARSQAALGQTEAAEKELVDAAATLKAGLGARHPETLRALASLAEVFLLRGRPDEAARQWQTVLDSTGGSSPPAHAARLGLAEAQAATGQNETAKAALRSLMADLSGERDRAIVWRASLVLARILQSEGQLSLAIAACSSVLAEQEKRRGPTHPDTLETAGFLASLHEQQGSDADVTAAGPHPGSATALALRRRVAEGLDAALGAAHPRTVAAQKILTESCERLGDDRSALDVTLASAHALLAAGREKEAMERFVNAARLARSLVPAESADRYLTQAWTIARQEKVPTTPDWPPRSRLVRFDRNGHWYQRLEVPMSWTDASAACQALGGHLATPTSAEENDFLFSTFATVTLCWLGASLDDAGKWHWVTSEAWDWQHWAGGEPSNWGGEERFLNFGSSNITFLRKGAEWNDHRDLGDHAGWVLTYPLCEWEGTEPPPRRKSPASHAIALPRTSVRFSQSTGHWYARINDTMSWAEAVDVCQALGGHLATAASTAEDDFLFQQFATDRLCWLGGHNNTPDGQWHWVTDEPWSHTRWDGGQPDNWEGRENFLAIGRDPQIPLRTYGPMWNDMSLEGDKAGGRLAHHPICEWEKKPAFP